MLEKNRIVTIGKFDGVHLGHQALLQAVRKEKKKYTNAICSALLISMHTGPYLMTQQEREQKLKRFGIEELILQEEIPGLLQMEPEFFVTEWLQRRWHTKALIVGNDFRFGNQRKGDVLLLKQLTKQNGITLDVISTVSLRKEVVRSTNIRKALLAGKMELVSAMLGEPYQLEGIIVKGNQIGRTMGMPTINFFPDEQKVLPPNGVYHTITSIAGEKKFGITNIGQKPTLQREGIHRCCVETHLLGESKDYYGQLAKVEFYSFQRRERKFSSLELLAKQMRCDLARATLWMQEVKRKGAYHEVM